MNALRIAIVLLSLACGPAIAQQTPPSEADDSENFDITESAPAAWQVFGDAQMRGDRVTGLPGGRADLQRMKFRVRTGLSRDDDGPWAAGIALRLAAANDRNQGNIVNNDNERSDDVGIDQAWLHLRVGEHSRIDVGKAPMPLALTPMLWDPDLRPRGAVFAHTRSIGTFDRLHWSIAALDMDHPLADGPRLHAAQLGWHWREGAPLSFSAVGSYLAFERIDPLARAGLARGNPVRNGRYLDDYRLVDMQFALRRNAQGDGAALEARIDAVRNLGASRAGDGARLSLVWGGVQPGQWEASYAYQRIQAAAVLAAANSDDWWFHAGARGHMASMNYAFDPVWNVRVSGFSETRDGLEKRTHRLLLELQAHW